MCVNQKYPMLERMQKLNEQITEADIAYYQKDNPMMTDREYDALYDELKLLEEQSGIHLSNSPTQKVAGEILDELTPVQHSKPMLSANKTKFVEDLVKFAKGKDVTLSWKLDGLTLVLRYDNGNLVQAITRGREGVIGEDVTHTVKHFLNVPLTVPTKLPFEVRGEGVISWDNFQKINETLEEPYSHPRNLASGSVRKLDSNDAKSRCLELVAFEVVTLNGKPMSHKEEDFEFLEENGFSVVPHVYITEGATPDQIEKAIKMFEPKAYTYPVDGLIMEYADLAYGRSLGNTGHHENRLIAFKWQDETVDTKFKGVELATTRTGMVSITGLFEPVEIDGTMVSRAYLHNLDIFDAFQFGIGDTISVYKANMIIPQIAENKTKSNSFKLSMECPCCGAPLVEKRTTGGTRELFCENASCSAKLVQKFEHFCEKTRMNIEGLSGTTLKKFVSRGWIKNFGDLYELERYRDEIVETDGCGEKSFERLQKSIEKSRECTLAKFIAALGIPLVGRHAGRDIDEYFNGSWDDFEMALQFGFDFTQLPNFGAMMQKNLYAWYADREEEKLWRPLLSKIKFTKETKIMANEQNKTNPFYGKTVVVTGTFSYGTRGEVEARLASLGATPSSSVTKKTDYVLYGDKPGSKLQKALNLGIKTRSEEEFEQMLEEAGV